MNIQAEENYLDLIKELSTFMTNAQIAKKLGLSNCQIGSAKNALKMRQKTKTQMMDTQTSRGYYAGKLAAVEGLPPTSCPYWYNSEIKYYCAWMGGYNDHKNTRKM